ncbi:hypothetical protein [Streptomyces sp. NPDC092370]|uniref:hypothetical protein n=1 Tax=Streptomyces sp. NPDC092370 TaxID=3366016 RepID=UPI0037F1E0CB
MGGARVAVVEEGAFGDGGDGALVGAERTSAKTRTVWPLRICGARWKALVANAPGRGKVRAGPLSRMCRSVVACVTWMGWVSSAPGPGIAEDGRTTWRTPAARVAAGGPGVCSPARLDVREQRGDGVEQAGPGVVPEAYRLGAGGQTGPPRVAGPCPCGRAGGDEAFGQGVADVSGGTGHCDHGGLLGAGSSVVTRGREGRPARRVGARDQPPVSAPRRRSF